MERYDYYESVKSDVLDYISENEEELKALNLDADEMYEHLNDELFISDSVTGNASGSYYCNTWKAEEAICHNLDLLAEALEEFGETDINIADKGAEWADVTIRCYVLSQVLADAIEESKICEQEEED